MKSDVSKIRQILSDELHARAFSDFTGAGRFIRFVYLVGNDDSAILKYVNKYLLANSFPIIRDTEKFQSVEFEKFTLRIERHTEFLTISFVESGFEGVHWDFKGCLSRKRISHIPFAWTRNAPAKLFHNLGRGRGQAIF